MNACSRPHLIDMEISQTESGLGLEELSCEPSVNAALRQFRLIFGTFHQHFRKVEPKCGTSGAQIWILAEVIRAPGIGISDLSRKLGVQRSTGSLMVRKMLHAELLSKKCGLNDQRRIRLYVTAKGKKILAMAQKPPDGALPTALSTLSRVELEALCGSLTKVVAKLGLSDEQFEMLPFDRGYEI